FRHVTPLLLKELARAWSPVRALRTLDRFLVSIALDRDALEAFVGRQEIVAPLVQLFSGSQALSSILIHRPHLVLEPGFGEALARDPTVQEHVTHLMSGGGEGEEDLAVRLRLYQRRQLLYIGLKDLSRQAGPASAQRAITALAESILTV